MSRVASPRVLVVAAFWSCLSVGCAQAPEPSDQEDELGQTEEAITEGNWADYGSGQCVAGLYTFYSKYFHISLEGTCAQATDVGNCEVCGACMIYESTHVEPSDILPTKFNKYAWGSVMPQTYDIVVYPPETKAVGYGHVAAVDHMNGTNKSDWQALYVMDSNYVAYDAKASAPHTVNRAPYGFFRLKALEPKNAPPTGALESADCDGGVNGWAQDADAKTTSIDVQLWFDAESGKPGAFEVPVLAAVSRPDLQAQLGSANHGFTSPIPFSMMDGTAHSVWAYGIDTAAGPNTILPGSPATFTCQPPAPPAGIKRLVSAPNTLTAWNLSGVIDLAHEPDSVVDAIPQGADWESAPALLKADDGSPETWVIDGTLRRKVVDLSSFDAWRFTQKEVQTVPAKLISEIAQGPDFAVSPFMIQGATPDIYVMDVSPDAPSKASGSGGSKATSSVASTTASVGGSGGSIDSSPSVGSCSSSSGTGGSPSNGLAVSLLAGIFAISRRRAARPKSPDA